MVTYYHNHFKMNLNGAGRNELACLFLLLVFIYDIIMILVTFYRKFSKEEKDRKKCTDKKTHQRKTNRKKCSTFKEEKQGRQHRKPSSLDMQDSQRNLLHKLMQSSKHKSRRKSIGDVNVSLRGSLPFERCYNILQRANHNMSRNIPTLPTQPTLHEEPTLACLRRQNSIDSLHYRSKNRRVAVQHSSSFAEDLAHIVSRQVSRRNRHNPYPNLPRRVAILNGKSIDSSNSEESLENAY